LRGSNKDGIELIAVVLGAEKSDNQGNGIREKDCKNLFEFIYNNFSEKTLATTNTSIKNIKVSNGTADTKKLDLLPQEEIKALITNDRTNENINPEIKLNDKIKAEIKQGDVLGTVKYVVDDIEYSTNLVAAHDVQKSKLFAIIVIILILIVVLYVLYGFTKSKKRTKSKNRKYQYYR